MRNLPHSGIGSIVTQGLFTGNEKHTHRYSDRYFLGVACQPMEVLTLNQFLSIYLVKWVIYPFALKLKIPLADLKCSISIVFTWQPFH